MMFDLCRRVPSFLHDRPRSGLNRNDVQKTTIPTPVCWRAFVRPHMQLLAVRVVEKIYILSYSIAAGSPRHNSEVHLTRSHQQSEFVTVLCSLNLSYLFNIRSTGSHLHALPLHDRVRDDIVRCIASRTPTFSRSAKQRELSSLNKCH